MEEQKEEDGELGSRISEKRLLCQLMGAQGTVCCTGPWSLTRRRWKSYGQQGSCQN